MKTERFTIPKDSDLTALADEIGGDYMDEDTKCNMCAFARLIIDRLYDTGDINKHSKAEQMHAAKEAIKEVENLNKPQIYAIGVISDYLGISYEDANELYVLAVNER